MKRKQGADPAFFLHPRVREIYRDRVLWVLDKPPGVLSHPNPPREESKATVVRGPYVFQREVYWLHGEDGQKFQLHLIHRLDQETSGLILCAFSAEAAAALKEALYHRELKKEYRALVLGLPRPPEGIWRDSLVRQPGKGQVRVVAAPGGRPNAETFYRTLKAFPAVPAAYLQLEPRTGRTHQLRVQAARRRLPIAGDERYGDFAANKVLAGRVGLKRMFLHAYRLELRHPRSGHRLCFTAELTGPLAEPLEKIAALREGIVGKSGAEKE